MADKRCGQGGEDIELEEEFVRWSSSVVSLVDPWFGGRSFGLTLPAVATRSTRFVTELMLMYLPTSTKGLCQGIPFGLFDLAKAGLSKKTKKV